VGRNGRRRVARVVALVTALSLFAAACGDDDNGGNTSEPGGSTVAPGGVDDPDAKPVPGGELVYALEAETSAGWCLAEAQLAISGIQVARAIYDTLTAPDENGEIKPFLAESFSSNEDSTQWTFKLRDGIKFHDGTDLTAEVVKNNLDAYRGQYEARNPLLFVFVFQDIESVTAVDRLTVRVNTKRPWVAFPWFMWGSGRVGIMGQKQLDSKQCNDDLIGTGPFKKGTWRVNDRFVADKNPDYWAKDADGNQLPYLDRIIFRPIEDGQARYNSLKSGEFDAIHTSSNQNIDKIRKDAENGDLKNVESDLFGEVSYTLLNAAKEPFNSRTARLAVAYGTDLNLVNEIQNLGIPTLAQGPFAPGNTGYLEDAGRPQFDEGRAKELVAQYKQEEGKDLAFTLTHAGDPETTALANLLKEQAANIGVNVDLVPVPDQSELINTAIGGTFEAVTWRNHPGADPDTQYVWWYNKATENPDGTTSFSNPVNFGRFDDPEINDLLDRGRTTKDPAARKQIYEDLNREFANEMYDLWGWYTIWSIGTKPDVNGILGPNLPDGSKPFPGLATGHPVSGIWRSK
jgi:peptide/nickel transport system substrate-binding protein